GTILFSLFSSWSSLACILISLALSIFSWLLSLSLVFCSISSRWSCRMFNLVNSTSIPNPVIAESGRAEHHTVKHTSTKHSRVHMTRKWKSL
uniref:Uncharacterized protein n=1 Tax=Anopheles atroparvus TaxID=41427 RepID=A0AAG5DFE3_ANOAO